ncbi:HLH-domain-containing protein [Backusella circina FSU 941]|nr:HLH-domain-containing protein [Backusella circina FSU 941]
MSLFISERRSKYSLHERMIVYGPESMERLLTKNENVSSIPENNSFMVNGINILNRNSLDCDTMMHRIMQRRKTHNRVERRRRDKMNSLFNDLVSTLPQKSNKTINRADILQHAIDYIKLIQTENLRLQSTFQDDDLSSVTTSSTYSSV